MNRGNYNIVALIKPAEKFVFIYPPTLAGLTQVRMALGRFAENPELDFTWLDAWAVGAKVDEQMERERAVRIVE